MPTKRKKKPRKRFKRIPPAAKKKPPADTAEIQLIATQFGSLWRSLSEGQRDQAKWALLGFALGVLSSRPHK